MLKVELELLEVQKNNAATLEKLQHMELENTKLRQNLQRFYFHVG